MDRLEALIISKDEHDVWAIVVSQSKSETGAEKYCGGQQRVETDHLFLEHESYC